MGNNSDTKHAKASGLIYHCTSQWQFLICGLWTPWVPQDPSNMPRKSRLFHIVTKMGYADCFAGIVCASDESQRWLVMSLAPQQESRWWPPAPHTVIVFWGTHSLKYVLKNVLDETEQIFILIKSHSLSTHPLNTLYSKMQNLYEELLLHPAGQWLPEEKALVNPESNWSNRCLCEVSMSLNSSAVRQVKIVHKISRAAKAKM